MRIIPPVAKNWRVPGMLVNYDKRWHFSKELQGPDVIPKDKRWESADYLKFISEMPCANCQLKDGTIVAHHLKHIYSPLSGGAGVKASDIFAMPLCFECHDRVHKGDRDVINWQGLFILQTLDKAVNAGVISIEYKPYEYNIL